MEEKKKHKIMIGIEVVLLCMIIAILGTSAASSDPPSNGVSYSKNSQTTVEGALNDLYNKANYGNATAAQILKGKTALVGGKKVTGTYEAPSLASLTPGDATAENIDEGKVAWVNGKKVVGATKKLTEKLKLGSYISYKPGQTSFTIEKSDTGYRSDQTINPSELTLWRVIRLKADGTVEIVSEDASSEMIRFGESFGENYTGWYKKYIETLNKIAASYETDGFTVGSRHVGYDGTAEEHLSSSISKPDNGYKTDISLLKAIGGYEAKATWMEKDMISGFDKTYIKLRGYLLASRGRVYTTSSTSYATVMKVMLQANDSSEASDVANSIEVTGFKISDTKRGDGGINSGYVRPVIILKSTLKITGGNGTSNSPYTLGI